MLKLENYPEKRAYRTNLTFPTSFWLVGLPARRGSDRATGLRPLEIGDYVKLPYHPMDRRESLYRITDLIDDHVTLEPVSFRMTITEE